MRTFDSSFKFKNFNKLFIIVNHIQLLLLFYYVWDECMAKFTTAFTNAFFLHFTFSIK